jgi:hypothetical protein
MRLKKYNPTEATAKALEIVFNGVQGGKSLKSIRTELTRLISSYNGLNQYERAHLVATATDIAKKTKANSPQAAAYLSHRTVYDQLDVATRKVAASMQLRNKRRRVRDELRQGDTIFFLCSYHSNPAMDHKDHQGKIYVDRFWRTKVNGVDYYKVASYIKNHNVETIQSIMGEPVYLTTRPYCKHYFTPVSTEDVLHSSAKSLLHQTHSFHYSQDTADESYYDRRAEVYYELDKTFNDDNFYLMAKRSNRKRR